MPFDWNTLWYGFFAAFLAATIAGLLALQTWFQEWRKDKQDARVKREEEAKDRARQAEEQRKSSALAVVARKADSTAAVAKIAATKAQVAAEKIVDKIDALHDAVNGSGILGELKDIRQAQKEHDAKDEERFSVLHQVIGSKSKSGKNTDIVKNPGDPFAVQEK